jgi:magnesium chelatase family protein
MLACATTFTLFGVDAVEVTVEADIHPGLPAFTIVGLPDTAVQESRERVRASLLNSQFEFPLRRITVNLAPADMRKAGPGFDLALAASVLAASGQVQSDLLARYTLSGELGLDGSIRPVRGTLAIADASSRAGFAGLIVPRENVAEASLVSGLDVVGVAAVSELADFLAGSWRPEIATVDPAAVLSTEPDGEQDLGQVRGHFALKRALEVAAAGGHNLLMYGPPGSGKSMAARRLPTILPPMTFPEALEVTRIHSVAGTLENGALASKRPFRAPHHSISSAGLIGGGSPPAPGEVSLAQRGVLFLDELAEFRRDALEALRQPLEEGAITLTRSQRTVRFPARFMLVAATNPCPCGRRGDPRHLCNCPPGALQRYAARLSGPLVDRIDLIFRVESPSREELMSGPATQDSAKLRERVAKARERQRARLGESRATCNADMSAAQAARDCRLEAAARKVLHRAHDTVGLTVRGHDRVMRVARTIADLEGRDRITSGDVAQAVAYRQVDSPDFSLARPA